VTDIGPAECRGISHYILWEDDNSGFTSPDQYTPTPPDSSYYDFESKSDGRYYYRAQAVDFAGNAGGNSSTVYIDVQRPDPPPPPEPAPPWDMIDDFSTNYGTAYEIGDSWGPWTYYESTDDAGNKVTWLQSKGTQSKVGKFYWGLNSYGTAAQVIYKDGSWDFSQSDKKWSILANNEDSVEDEDFQLKFRDNQGLWAESKTEESTNGLGWQRLEFELRTNTLPAGFNWSGINRIEIRVEKAWEYDSDRQLYFDEFAWNREIHLESSKYNVYPGDEFTLTLSAINVFGVTADMDFDIEINGIDCQEFDVPVGDSRSCSISKSKAIPGDYSYQGEVKLFDPSDIYNQRYLYSNTITIHVIDNSSPSVTITKPLSNQKLNTSSVLVQWSSPDSDIDHYEVKNDSEAWINKGTSTSHTFTGVSDGVHTVYVKAFDTSNNTGGDQVSFRVDTVAPDPPKPVTADPPLWTSTNSFDVTWTDPNDPSDIAGAYYKLYSPPNSNSDYDGYSTANPIPNIQVSTDGIHPIYVWLKDGAGNVDYNNAGTTDLNYDGTAPGAPINILWQDGQYSKDTAIIADWGDVSDTSGIQEYYLQVDVDSQDFTAGLNLMDLLEALSRR